MKRAVVFEAERRGYAIDQTALYQGGSATKQKKMRTANGTLRSRKEKSYGEKKYQRVKSK